MICFEAITAIALHDAALGESFNLAFDREPVASLLRVCDELQEWERLTVSDGVPLTEGSDVRLGPVISVGEEEFLGESLSITFRFHDAEILKQSKWLLDPFASSKETLRWAGFPIPMIATVELPLAAS
jgi:hypothetical protein